VDSLKTWKVRGAQFQRELRLRSPGSHCFRLAMAEILRLAAVAARCGRLAAGGGSLRVARCESDQGNFLI
jgi:hypothetical protein